MKVIWITSKEIQSMMTEIDKQLDGFGLRSEVDAIPDFSERFKEALATAICTGNNVLAFAAYQNFNDTFFNKLIAHQSYEVDCWDSFGKWANQRTSEIGKGAV